MPRSINGFGTTFYGEAELRQDGSFVTTRWFIVFWIPVLPTQSLRISYSKDKTSYVELESLPLAWMQILKTYAFAAFYLGWFPASIWASSLIDPYLDGPLNLLFLIAVFFVPLLLQRVVRYLSRKSMRKRAVEPLVPFEQWEIDVESPSGRKLLRPLVLCFERIVLPEALFTNNPELAKALGKNRIESSELLHFWSKSAALCMQSGIWRDGLINSDEHSEKYGHYLEKLCKSIVGEMHAKHGLNIWVLTMPRPVVAAEAFFIALCCRADGSHQQSVSQYSRYFTLERSVFESSAFFCEWTIDGKHANLGPSPVLTSSQFAGRVFEQLTI